MVDRRALLVGAAAAALAGCGSGGEETPDQIAERLVTSVQGDIELLRALIDQESLVVAAGRGRIRAHARAHIERLLAAIDELSERRGGVTARVLSEPRSAREVTQETIALYVDTIPKLSDAEVRQLAAGILTAHASALATLTDPPAPDAFVYGKAPDA